MKIIITSLVALSFAASLAASAEAATRKHKKRLARQASILIAAQAAR